MNSGEKGAEELRAYLSNIYALLYFLRWHFLRCDITLLVNIVLLIIGE